MSNENLQASCKPRFKGVENFLRRVAFNLGNTPSQTEVKIISCIPIDVTDLQQKITSLEKQLCEAQGKTVIQNVSKIPINDKSKSTDKPGILAKTDMEAAPYKQPNTVAYCSNSLKNMKADQIASHCKDFSTRMKKSNVSFIFPALSALDGEHTSKFGSCECSNNSNQNGNIGRCRNIFRKRRKKKGNCKLKTHFVYYAQTPKNPFNLQFNTQRTPSSTEVLCLSHLNSVIKRQYDPDVVIEEFSDTSNFTRPVCRDSGYKFKAPYESDVCSCCHGTFQDIDKFMTNTNFEYIIPKVYNSMENTKMYYDSKDYDIIPVKENSNKLLKENINKKENKLNIDFRCWPEDFRTKYIPYRYHPIIVNYQTETPVKRRGQKHTEKVLKVKDKPKKTPKKLCNTRINQRINTDTSKSCSIECGNIYTKRNFRNAAVCKSPPVKVTVQKNEMVSTENIDGVIQVNTQSTQIELNTSESLKTESTLDQIKTMLESVLAEVKTSAKLSNALEEKPKRDAVVQKGASQNNMQGASTLIHSFSYNNSYNANPYLSSCSRQIPQQYCFPNYPVFIQSTPKKHMCACYYNKNDSLKQTTAAAATNTEKEIQNSSNEETEKLIKEIYKSMAINFDLTTKDNSLSECDDLKSDGFTNTTEMKSTGIVTSKRDMEVEAILTPFESKSNDSKTVYIASTQSEDQRSINEQIITNVRRNRDSGHDNHFTILDRRNDIIIEDDEPMDSYETDSDATVTAGYFDVKKNEKKSLFQRMFKSVKLFSKKKENQDKSRRFQEYEGSDSDDYETVYSEKFTRMPRSYKKGKKRKNYSKVTRVPESRNPERIRAPYLEQEFRRQWNEKLMFDEQQSKNSSVKRFTPPYCTNYEVRTTLTDRKAKNKNFNQHSVKETSQNETTKAKENISWLKKHKLGINCGEQWKKFILEN